LPVGQIHNLNIIYLEKGELFFHDEFKILLNDSVFKGFLLDTVDYSIFSFKEHYDKSKWNDGFILYRKYSRKDVFRILNVKENPVAQNVGGYLVSPDNKHCPIFVNYHKEEDISESTKYEDEFVNNKELDWMSKSKRKRQSPDVKSILGENGEIRLPLFIKKNNDEGREFYYMGDVKPELDKVEETLMSNDNGKKVSVVKIRFNLENPVNESMYKYLRESGEIKKKVKLIPKQKKVKQLELDYSVEESENVKTLQLYNFYAAAGSFSEMQSEKDFSLIELPERYSNSDDYFACKIVGESMNRVIPNGSVCLFRKYSGGSRNGKIVLVENFDYQDPDFNSAFTIKTYSSEKIVTEVSYRHTTIVLRPNSYDDSYENIIIKEEDGTNMRIVGEFIAVLA